MQSKLVKVLGFLFASFGPLIAYYAGYKLFGARPAAALARTYS